jgi:hypothetical protein
LALPLRERSVLACADCPAARGLLKKKRRPGAPLGGLRLPFS